MKKIFSNLLAKTDAAPAASPKILTDLLKTPREGIFIINAETRIVASNQAAYEAFSRDGGALENKRLTEIIRDLSVHEAFRKALKEGEASEINFEFPADEKRIYDVRIAPLELGGENCAIGIFYDKTQIEQLETMRQEFLSNVSHELRTPLTSIIAFVETLEDGALEDAENNRHFLAVIRRNAERMHRLIDDILELSAIEAGKVEVEPKNVDLAETVADIFTNLAGKAAEKQVELKNEVVPGSIVFADAVRLEQMLTNLIDNAIKFNRPSGKVTVSLKRGGGRDFISVEDTGEGISAEHLKRLFERFYRTDKARSREIGGTGLGLAIVKHLARLHGGEASVRSEVGKGSVFTIELPGK
mgnify:CR=1 FL=1|jgi:Signal transduction histidine kinase